MTSITDLSLKVPKQHATLKSVNSAFTNLDVKIQNLESSTSNLAEVSKILEQLIARIESIEKKIAAIIGENPKKGPTLIGLDVHSNAITTIAHSIQMDVTDISKSVANLNDIDFATQSDVAKIDAQLKLLNLELAISRLAAGGYYTSLHKSVDSIRKDCLRQSNSMHGGTETTPRIPEPVEGESNDNAYQGSDVFFHYNLARNSFFAGQYEKTIEYLDTGLTLGNHDARLYYLRCLANNRLGQPLNARADFEKATQQEMNGIPGKRTINDSLQRIQGFERLWLEELREGKR